MLSTRFQFAIVLAGGALLCLPARTQAQDVQVQEPTPTPPPGSLSAAPSEVAPAEVVVTYKNGELTIRARNVQFSDILRKICDQTGTVLDALSVANEKVFADLGPGPVKDVLGALLNNSTFNYVMVGSADDPSGLARVLVFPRAKNGNVEVAEVNQPSPGSTLTASNVQKPRQQGTKPSQMVGTATAGENARDADTPLTAKDANAVNLRGQFEALINAAADGGAVDETLLQALVQQASDATSPPAPGVDPSGPQPVGRPRHRKR